MNNVLINLEKIFFKIYIKKIYSYFSDSPTHFEIRSDEDKEKNVPSHSVAQAFAKKVLPVPGGLKNNNLIIIIFYKIEGFFLTPYKSIPFHGFLLPVNI